MVHEASSLVCCSNHAIDLCSQHFVTTDRSVYNACYHDAVNKCSSLCRADIDQAVGPNRQQLSCASTAVRAVEQIKIQQEKNKEGKKLEQTEELLNDGLGNGTSDETKSDATLNRFLSRQAARLETVNQ